MLAEIWEKLRGYDKWSETTATVVSSVPTPVGVLEEGKANKNSSATQWNSAILVVWKDDTGRAHSEQFGAEEESPLYQLCDGDTLQVRVNPKRPEEIYVPGLMQSNVMSVWKGALTILIGMLLLFGFFIPEILRVISK